MELHDCIKRAGPALIHGQSIFTGVGFWNDWFADVGDRENNDEEFAEFYRQWIEVCEMEGGERIEIVEYEWKFDSTSQIETNSSTYI